MPLRNFLTGLLWSRIISEKPIFSELATTFVKSECLPPRLEAPYTGPYLRHIIIIIVIIYCN